MGRRKKILSIIFGLIFLFILLRIFPNLYLVPFTKYILLNTSNYQNLFVKPEKTINIPNNFNNKDCNRLYSGNLSLCLYQKSNYTIKYLPDDVMLARSKNNSSNILIIPSKAYMELITETCELSRKYAILTAYSNTLGVNALKNPYELFSAVLNLSPSNVSLFKPAFENTILLTFLLLKSGEVGDLKNISHIKTQFAKGYQFGLPLVDKGLKVFLFFDSKNVFEIVFSGTFSQEKINGILSSAKIIPNK